MFILQEKQMSGSLRKIRMIRVIIRQKKNTHRELAPVLIPGEFAAA